MDKGTLKEKILKEVSRCRIIEKNKYGRGKEEIHKEHQETYEGKPLHGQFRKATEEVRSKNSWDWLKKGYVKEETESAIIAAQDQTVCTRNLRNVVCGENVQSICRVYSATDETVAHIVSECSKLAQKEYKQARQTTLPKCFIGSYVKNGVSIKQRNGTYTSYKKF